MAFIRPLLDVDKPNIGEELYYATVVDNNDPSELNRVKVRIFELHGTEQNIPDENLPWAVQLRPNFLGGDTNVSSTFVPRVGSQVMITHIRGDIYQPAYVFELYQERSKVDKGSTNYPDSYAFKDSDENYWHVDLVEDKLDIKFNGSEVLTITVDRTTTIGQDDIRTVTRDETNNINRDSATEVGRDESKNIGNNQSVTVNNSRTENVGGDLLQTIGQTKTVTVPTLNINSSSEVNITSPSVNVTGGTVTVTGGDVTADGISLKNHTHLGDSGGFTGTPL
jgi:uncharacterized protein involved in type VI secretion and phage assembly